MNITHFLLVGAGGCIGSMARHLAVISIDKRLNAIFPFGTFAVNVVGSFILGFILAWVTKKTGMQNEAWKMFLGTGFCGGFTTFSTFTAENLNLFEQRLPATALVYIGLSVIAGLLSVWAGVVLGRNIL